MSERLLARRSGQGAKVYENSWVPRLFAWITPRTRTRSMCC